MIKGLKERSLQTLRPLDGSPYNISNPVSPTIILVKKLNFAHCISMLTKPSTYYKGSSGQLQDPTIRVQLLLNWPKPRMI